MKRLLCLLCAVLMLGGCAARKKIDADNLRNDDTVSQVVKVMEGRTENLITFAQEYTLENFQGEPCHMLLVQTSDGQMFAYSFASGSVYAFEKAAVEAYAGGLETEEDRCLYLLHAVDSGAAVYVSKAETKSALTTQALAVVNMSLAFGDTSYAPGDYEVSRAEASEETSAAEETAQPTEATEKAAKSSEKLEFPDGEPLNGADYRVIKDLPEAFTKRVLSDDEIFALRDADLETLREEISTPADFAAWIDTQPVDYYSNISNSSGQREFGADIWYNIIRNDVQGEPATTSLAVRILGDDIPGIGIAVAVTDFEGGLIVCGNVIPTENGYYVYSLDYTAKAYTQSNAMSEAFPLLYVEKLESLVSYCGSKDDVSTEGGTLTQLFYLPNDAHVALSLSGGAYVPQNSTNAVELYRNGQYLDNWDEIKYGHIKPENIDSYALSRTLGGTTMSAEEAYALLDMTPEEVKDRVHTAGDLLMYMLAAKIGDNGGDRCIDIDGKQWHYNMNAFEVMQTHLGNCGSMANLANYLLEGDYDEIGFIEHAYYIGNGGGHVYNYILYEGSYYIVDFSWYIFANYEPSNDFPVKKFSSLEDYGKDIDSLYGGVCMALAHRSAGQHLPNVFDDGAKKYAIPAGAEYTLLYQETGSDCYELAEYPLDTGKLDWTHFE